MSVAVTVGLLVGDLAALKVGLWAALLADKKVGPLVGATVALWVGALVDV